jgi:hypothetical protein
MKELRYEKTIERKNKVKNDEMNENEVTLGEETNEEMNY